MSEFKDGLQLTWSAFTQKSTDNAAAKDSRKRLQTCVSANNTIQYKQICNAPYVSIRKRIWSAAMALKY